MPVCVSLPKPLEEMSKNRHTCVRGFFDEWLVQNFQARIILSIKLKCISIHYCSKPHVLYIYTYVVLRFYRGDFILILYILTHIHTEMKHLLQMASSLFMLHYASVNYYVYSPCICISIVSLSMYVHIISK